MSNYIEEKEESFFEITQCFTEVSLALGYQYTPFFERKHVVYLRFVFWEVNIAF